MKLLQIGNRIINAEHVTHAAYTQEMDEPSPKHPEGKLHKQCDVNFGEGNYQIFYDDEADQVWSYLSASMHCRNITPRAEVAA